MVFVKKLFILTSLILSGVVAAPIADSDLSVRADKLRARDNFAIEARDLNDASVVDIEARGRVKSTPKKTTPKKTTPKKTTPKLTTPKKTSKIAPAGPSPTKPSKATKSAGVPSKTSMAAAPACPMPTKKPRSLERRMGEMVPARNQMDIDEDTFVIDAKGTSAVTNLSGCTAVYLWDASNVPSVFHILCGDEEEKAWIAIDKVQQKAKAFSIVASSDANYNRAKRQITEYVANEGWPKMQEEPEPLYKVDKTNKTLVKLTARSGRRQIKRSTYPNPNYCGGQSQQQQQGGRARQQQGGRAGQQQGGRA